MTLPRRKIQSFRRLLIADGIMLLLCAILFLLSLLPDGAFFRVYTPWSKAISGFLGFLVSFAPFSVAELLLYALIVYLLYVLVRGIVSAVRRTDGKRQLQRCAVIWLTAAVTALTGFTAVWGLQYRAPPLEKTLELPTSSGSQDTLYALTEWLLEQVNENAPLVSRGADGAMEAGFSELAGMSVRAVEKLASVHDAFSRGWVTRPKRVTAAFLMDYNYIAGIYSPFTGEGNVNPNMAPAFLPETMTHEMAHRLGFAAENDAGFVSFLACIGSDDPELRYSAALTAFGQCAGKLESRERYEDLMSRITPSYFKEHARQRETKAHMIPAVAEITSSVSEAANDGYLRAMGQTDGVRSYGRVVDLLLSWYEQGSALKK